MTHCRACGREISGQGEICPECQALGHLRPQSGPIVPAKPKLMHEVTILFIGLNVLVFLLMVIFGASPTRPSQAAILFWGGNQGGLIMLKGEYWRLLTSNYVHVGIIHLGVNMYCLWGLGQLTELFYTKRDYFILYTFTGIAGSVLSMGLHPGIVSAGASGAVFGVAGVLLTTLKFGRLPLPDATRTALFKSILQFAGINLVMGFFVLRVDNAGHIGGLLAGLIVGGALGKHLDGSEAAADRRRRTWLLLWMGLAVCLWLVVRFWVR